MAKKSMGDYAKGWKSPEERREAKMAARAADKPKSKGSSMNREEMAEAKKVAKTAPPDTTKGKGGKNSPDSKGPGPDDYMKGMKKPKGGGK